MPGMSIAYQVRRTGRRSKNISVRVHHDGTVRVGAPTWASRREINRVVNLHAQWIAQQVAEARALAPRSTTARCIISSENAIRSRSSRRPAAIARYSRRAAS